MNSATTPIGDSGVPGGVAPSSILATRIAVDLDGSAPPSLAALGLVDGKTRAFEWQQQRSHAVLNDLHGHLSGKPGGRWITETHGIFGVVAEQVLVAIEAEVEKAICRGAIDAVVTVPGLVDADRAGRHAHYSRSLRFFGEGQANALVVGLHGLANLVLRSLEFDRPLDASELTRLGIKGSDFTPGSLARSAWISIEPMAPLKAAAANRSAAAAALVDALEGIRTESAVAALLDLRNTHYHRWRGESPGVTGIPLGMPTVADRLDSHRVVPFGRELLPPYEDGDAKIAELTRTSRAALDAVISHMEPFHRAWWDLFTDAFVGNTT